PVPAFREVNGPADVVAAADELGWPLMLKARRDGYDGRGNALVHAADEAAAACRGLGWPDRALFVEAFVDFERELASLVGSARHGRTTRRTTRSRLAGPHSLKITSGLSSGCRSAMQP